MIRFEAALPQRKHLIPAPAPHLPSTLGRGTDEVKNKLLNNAIVYAATLFDYAALGDATLEQQARDAADKIRSLQRGAAVDIGRELAAMKEKLAHGQFDKWVSAEFSWSKSTALNMMRVAKEFGDEYATVAHLPPAMIYQLASPSTPAAVREAVKQLKPGEQVAPFSIKRMISDAKRTEFKQEQRVKASKPPSEQDTRREKRVAKQDEKIRLEREAEKARAAAPADKLRSWLGGHYSEFREMMKGVDRYCFSTAIQEMLDASDKSEKVTTEVPR